MVRIRLSRAGRKNAPAYRIVVTDRKTKRDGKSIELIGHYNPTEDSKKIVYKKDRYDYWVSVGAQPSDAIVKLMAGTYKFTPYNPKAKAETGVTEPEPDKSTVSEEAPAAAE
jgi:small subunit ribosomal protein S16